MKSVLKTFSYSIEFLLRLVEDIAPGEMVLSKNPVVNHPAWTLGHLVYSLQALGGELDIEPWLASDWNTKFGTGTTPLTDRDHYPSKAQLVDAIENGRQLIIENVAALTPDQLQADLPDESMRKSLPTVEDAIVQVLTAHTSYHVGQVAVWRKLMGKPPIGFDFI